MYSMYIHTSILSWKLKYANTSCLLHTHTHSHMPCRPASFPHSLCEASISAITGLYPWLATLPLASTLYPRVMNYCPPTRGWVHLQKRYNSFLNTCFEGTPQLLSGESVEQRVKYCGSISHCQKAESEPHQAITGTQTQDQNVDCRQRGPAAQEGGYDDEGHF